MRPWRRRWVVVLAGAIILVNVLALSIGIYLPCGHQAVVGERFA